MVRNVHGTVVIVRENLLVKKLSSEKVDCAAAISYNLACDLNNLLKLRGAIQKAEVATRNRTALRFRTGLPFARRGAKAR